MGAADDRVSELLDRWLASVELHARYLSLDDDAYAKVEDWPPHQRPTRWLVDIARTRCEELKRQLAERRARGDESFADALELMAFLTNLMGSGHVERFIPLATGRAPKARPVAAPAPPAAAARASTRSGSTTNAAGTLPRPGSTGRHSPPRAPTPRKPADESAPSLKPSAPPKSTPAAKPALPAGDPGVATVISDAVRMLSWGREWPQLAGLISRLAGRPDEKEVWVILRQHRAAIEAKAAQQAK